MVKQVKGMHDFKKLRVWEESYQLALRVYKITTPIHNKDWDLIRQSRRSASSIPTNVAEGCGRHSRLDQAHFYQIAFGSANELENQFYLLRDLGYIESKEIDDLLQHLTKIRMMLSKLIAYKRK